MTSNNSPFPYVISASSQYSAQYEPWKAFNKNIIDVQESWLASTKSGWIQVKLASPKTVVGYEIHNTSGTSVGNAPRSFTFEGSNNGSSWYTLDIRSDETNWGTSESRYYTFINSNPYLYYRLNVAVNNGTNYLGIAELAIFEGLITNKTILTVSNKYKIYKENKWIDLNIVNPTEQDYLDYGMDDLSIIPESAWQELEGEVELCYYTDDPNKNEASFNITTTPFTLAEEWEDKTISVIEYTDDPNSNESSITLETEPFTIYDELGDEVDVLYYTDDPDKNEAKLNITANYSPLDELEGDFDVVTYSEDLSESDTLALNVEALPKGQLIIDPNKFAYLGDIKSFISSIEGNQSGEILRYLISFDDGVNWESYSQGLKSWRTVNISNTNEIKQYGMRDKIFNNIPTHKITERQNGNIKLSYYIEESHHTTQNIALDYISYRSMVPKEDVKFSDLAFYILNTTAKIDLQFGGNKLTGTLSDKDLTKVQYRVLLNGKPYHPINGEFTRLNAPPVNISLNINERDIIFEKENVLRVEFKDSWGELDAWEPPPFIGTYSGIMFKDEKGKYLSNSFGDILKRLDFDVIIAGQISLEQKVIAKNETGQRVQNLLLEVNKDVLPEGVELQLSRSVPFINESPLLFNSFFEPNEEFEFYVRIKTEIEAPANANGIFEVKAKVQPV
jgi:hypothetical protein